MGKKINSIEGLRTIGWIGVFLCHFKGAFFPGITWITDFTPLRFIYSGNAYVRLLFVISGFVISYKYFTKECYEDVFKDIIKRYFRLMPPVFFCEILVFVFMKLGCLRNAEVAELVGSTDFLGMFNQFEPDLLRCLAEALGGTYLIGANGYIGPLWTMVYEYLGALLVLCALGILKKSYWRWLFYLVMLISFSNYYNYFILGMLICDLFVNSEVSIVLSKNFWVNAAFIIGGYYALSMINLSDSDKISRIIFAIGIVLFMLGVLSGKNTEKILGNHIMVSGGKLAYSAYIIHWPIIESISCGLVLLMFDKGIQYNLMIVLILIITFLMIVIFSVFISKYIEPIGQMIAKNLI